MSKSSDDSAPHHVRMPILRKVVKWIWIIIFAAFIYACFIDSQWLDRLLYKTVDATALPDHFIKMAFFFSLFLFACISFMFIVYTNGEGNVTDHAKAAPEHDDDRGDGNLTH